MWQFIEEHFEGIIALILGVLLPVTLYSFKLYKDKILEKAEEKLNATSKRFDRELIAIKEKIIVLKYCIDTIDERNAYHNKTLKYQLERLETDLSKLDLVQSELQSTRELLLVQHNTLQYEIKEFKKFYKNINS